MSWTNKENNLNIDNMTKSQVQNLAKQISNKGRFGDTTIRKVKGKPSHVNLLESLIIDKHGKKGENFVAKMGSGTINPETGLNEYFLQALIPFIPYIIATVQTLGMHRLAGGEDAWTNPTGAYGTKRWKSSEKGKWNAPTSFEELMNLYQSKGQYKDRGSFGNVIKSMRHKMGGYGTEERDDWNQVLGTGLDAMGKFNPMTALSDIMDPLKKQASATIQGLTEKKRKGTRAAASELSKLGMNRGTSMPSIGRGEDIFGLGASMQGEADRLMQFDVDKQMAELAQRKSEGEQGIFQDWISTL